MAVKTPLSEEEKKWNRQTRHHILWILGVALVVLPLSTWVATMPALFDRLNLTAFGTIGDTIGGVTAPIIGLGGAILVYISFREQVRANRIQFNSLLNQRNFELNYKMYLEICNDIEYISSYFNKSSEMNPGTIWRKALELIDKGIEFEGNSVTSKEVKEVYKLLYDFMHELIVISDRLIHSDDPQDKILLGKIWRQYDFYLRELLEMMDTLKEYEKPQGNRVSNFVSQIRSTFEDIYLEYTKNHLTSASQDSPEP